MTYLARPLTRDATSPSWRKSLLLSSALGLGVAVGAASAQVTPEPIAAGDDSLFEMAVLTTGLSNPWAMQWGPDGKIWVTERNSAEITAVDPLTGVQTVLATIEGVYTGAQHEGLLGLVLHPEMGQGTGNDVAFISYTVNNGTADAPDPTQQLVKLTYDAAAGTLGNPEVVMDSVPAWNDHNAGRLAIGPDGKIYWSLGDQGGNFGRNYMRPSLSQLLPTQDEVDAGDHTSYTGKILRLNLDGSIPEDNPELDGVRSHIYSYGHRNPQGLAFGPDGTLYVSEHGPSSDDELNVIVAGGNYGWPNVAGYRDNQWYEYANWSEGPEGLERAAVPPPEVPRYPETDFPDTMVDPIATYFTVAADFVAEPCGFICNPTIAPGSVLHYSAGEGGIAAWDNSLLIPTLKNGVIYVQPLSDDGQTAEGEVTAWLSSQNRLRDVIVSADGTQVFVATDAFGSLASKVEGDALNTNVLHNPGAILVYRYTGESTASQAAPAEDAAAQEAPATEAPAEDSAAAEAEAPAQEQAAVATEESLEAYLAAGQPLYTNNCVMCHGAAGEGGVGVKLAGNENLGREGYVPQVLIHGFGYMPPFGAALDDAQVAQISTYIMNSFGNDFGLVTAAEATAAR